MEKGMLLLLTVLVIATRSYLTSSVFIDDEFLFKFRRYVNTQLNATSWGINVTAGVYAKSILSLGDIEMMTTLYQALAAKKCLNVVTFGGSVCEGADIPYNAIELRRKASFSGRLVHYLNMFFPCYDGVSNSHLNLNECINGQGSPCFIDKLMLVNHYENLKCNYTTDEQRLCIFSKNVFSADLFLIDTALNDAGSPDSPRMSYNYSTQFNTKAEKNMEILSRLISKFPKFPSIVFIGTSFHPEHMWYDRLDFPRDPAGDVIYDQARLAKYLKLPYISAIDAMGPFDNEMKRLFYRDRYLYRGTHHPQELGHEFIAALIMNYIITNQIGNGYPSTTMDITDHRYPKLLAVKLDELSSLLKAQAVMMSFESAVPIAKSGNWTWLDERKGKAGLISRKIGDNITYPIPNLFRANVGIIHVNLLKSYEHMGNLKVLISSSIGTLYEGVIDCKWDKHTSEGVVETIQFRVENNVSNIIVSFINETPVRIENKIKLIYMTVY
jgi:hypothetical protein